MFNKVKELFRPKCSFCDNKADDAYAELNTKDGPFRMRVCHECERIFEKAARLYEEKRDNGKT